MIISLGIRVAREERAFERLIEILMKENNLIKGRLEDDWQEDYRVLVWKDKEGIGRYRIHCYKKVEEGYDGFVFHYWEANLTPELFSLDPLKPIIEKSLKLIKNYEEVDYLRIEI